MTVAGNIKRFREDMGLTQGDLADKLGVARSTVTQWENGWSSPRMGMVQKLAGVFRVTTSDIVADNETPTDSDPDFERLARNYRALGPEGRAALVATSDALAERLPQAPEKASGGGPSMTALRLAA